MTEVNDDFFAWFVSRLKGTNDIPNFTALLSKLTSREVRMMTARSFIPILPYPATLMDSIYTSMMNFKDVLHQIGESSGALWCDEGVYCLAKDIQLLKPELFGSIFLGLGPFHWSKIIMGAIGKWLNPSGIGEALKKSGVFAADVALSSVLKGGDYMKAKDGINIIAESILRLQYEAFLESDEFILCKEEIDLDGIEFDIVQQVLTKVYDNSDGNDFESCWESYKVSLDRLHKAFLEFKGSNHENENFLYWELFLKDMFPCARDLEVSVRTGNWELFLSAVERSLGIFFGTGKPNYSRYGALFYQDCLDVQRKFPALHKHFKDGNFVCYLSERKGSAIGFDQALEKAYNFTAKAAGGIIGSTRQKEAVALWNIIKHHKDLFVSFLLKETADTGEHQGELNHLHHEFNLKSAGKGKSRVEILINYIETVGNPFEVDSSAKLINLTSREVVENTEYLLNCVEFGRANHAEFVQERLVDKSKSLHASISFKYQSPYMSIESTVMAKQKKVKVLTDDQLNTSAVNFIEYAASRGWGLEEVIIYPLTSRPVYLLEKDSLNQKKAPKSDLAKQLLQLLDKESIVVNNTNQIPHVETTAVVIDFMAIVRKLTSVKLTDVKTFGSFCEKILNNVTSYGQQSEQIHLILENYKDMSIKGAAQATRATKDGNLNVGAVCEVVSEEQSLPSPLDDFFDRQSNKISYQNFFVKYCSSHYKHQSHYIWQEA